MRRVDVPDFELGDGRLQGSDLIDGGERLRFFWREPEGVAEVVVSLRSLAQLGAAALRNRTRRAASAGHVARRI